MARTAKPDKTALMCAADLLARQEQSAQRLREKLLRKGFAAEEAEQAIARLEEKHYLDDAETCAHQFRFLYEESRNSVRQICLKLMQRGFEASLVRACVPQDTYERERRAALRCLAVKFRPGADRQKMMQHLYAKGFDSSLAREAATEFAAAEESGE